MTNRYCRFKFIAFIFMNDSYTPLFEFIFGGGIKANCDRIIQRRKKYDEVFTLYIMHQRTRVLICNCSQVFFSATVQLELFHSSDRLQSLASSGANSATKLAKGTITNHSSQVLPLQHSSQQLPSSRIRWLFRKFVLCTAFPREMYRRKTYQ